MSLERPGDNVQNMIATKNPDCPTEQIELGHIDAAPGSTASADLAQTEAADAEEQRHSALPAGRKVSSINHAKVHSQSPDGGKRAWLVVLGGFLNMIAAHGLMTSFGTFQAFYDLKWQDKSTSNVSWIGSLQLFLLFAGGIVICPIFERLGSRDLMYLGTSCVIGSLLLTSWTTEFWHYLLNQGILFGFGNALLFYPTILAISEWFDKKRALALGIAISGSSVGGVCWPLMISHLLDMMTEEEVHTIIAVSALSLLTISCLFVRELHPAASRVRSSHISRPANCASWPRVLDKKFLALSGAIMLLCLGMLIPFYFIPLYALEHGSEVNKANGILAIACAASFPSRIAAGWLADRFGRFNILINAGLMMSLVIGCWTWMTSFGGMVTFAVLFGLFSGPVVPLALACVAQTTKDKTHIGLRIGAMMAMSSIGALVGGPISGKIKDESQSWFGVNLFASSTAAAGAYCLYGVQVWHTKRWISKM